MTLFGLIDGNNFFVSCERIFRPDLTNKPVAVLSNNDGCFISRSNEVKVLGIPMGAPLFKYKRLVNHYKIEVFSANFALYGDISNRLMGLVASMVPRLEVYSIDEAFIDLTNTSTVLKKTQHIRQQVFQGLGVPTCIGIAPTKTLAKVANYLAKKNAGYNGVCFLQDTKDIQVALKGLKVDEIWGVGRRLSLRFKEAGINTAYDLPQVDLRWMRQIFTVVGGRLVNELNGISCFALDEQKDANQSIQVTLSFDKDILNFDELRSYMASYAARLGLKLRQQALKTANLLISIKTNRFKADFFQESFAIKLLQAINDDTNLIKACCQGLEKIYRPGLGYKKVGVMALDLRPASHQQYSLFAEDIFVTSKRENLVKVMDSLNKKYGIGTLHMAACGAQLAWNDRKDKKSPAYTTSWQELPIVYAKR